MSLDPHNFVFTFVRLRRALRREFDCRTTGLGITGPQFQVLNRLWEGDGILASALASEVFTDPGTLSGLLDRLERRGLIRRARCAADRRTVEIFLTDAGRELEKPLEQIVSAMNEKALQKLTTAERTTLFGLLERVGVNLD